MLHLCSLCALLRRFLLVWECFPGHFSSAAAVSPGFGVLSRTFPLCIRSSSRFWGGFQDISPLRQRFLLVWWCFSGHSPSAASVPPSFGVFPGTFPLCSRSSSRFWGAFQDIFPLEKYILLKDTPFPGGNVNTAISFPHRKDTFPQHRLNKCNSTQRKIILPTHPLPDNILSLPRGLCKIRLRPAFTLQDITYFTCYTCRKIRFTSLLNWNLPKHLLEERIYIP